MTDANTIRKAAVIGSGTMGAGIAQVCAMAGCTVRLVDVEQDRLDQAVERITANLDKGIEKGKVDPVVRKTALDRLETSTDTAAACDGIQLAIEAVPEDMDLKKGLFKTLDAAAPADAILASNTSSLSVAEIAGATGRPGQVVGLHFFNPVHILPLVEVVHHDGNDPGVVDTATAFAERLGKTPIRVKDSPGFASSRLGLALGLEAIRMVEEGVASPEDIDTAMTLGYKHPMGPLRLTDLVGLDVRLGIARHLAETLDDRRFEPPALLERMVEEGRLGRKSGEGFYKYE